MIKCKNIKIVYSAINFSILFSIAIVMFATFLTAFLNGGTVTITINNYGEMMIELFVIPAVLIISVVLFKKSL